MSLVDKIKKQFQTTIPEDYELEFDICMKCGRRLPDKKYSTWKSHQEAQHKLTKKQVVKTFFFKHPLISMILILSVLGPLLLVMMPLVDEYITNPIIVELQPDKSFFLAQEQVDFCVERSVALKELIYEKGDFTIDEVTEFNQLLHECNVDWKVFTYSSPIFQDDQYAEITP